MLQSPSGRSHEFFVTALDLAGPRLASPSGVSDEGKVGMDVVSLPGYDPGRTAAPSGWRNDRLRPGDYNESWVWMRLHDAEELRVLRDLLKPGETFVDIGAHAGVWSLVAGSAVGKSGKVVAIEPNPATYRKLEHNLRLNSGLTQWSPFQVAASARTGTAGFRIEEMSECCALADGMSGSVAVPTRSVDDLLQGEACQGIKIDVEGHELSVVEGAASTLKRWSPWLCVEFNNTIHKLASIKQWPVHEKLSELGYRRWLFRGATGRDDHPDLSPDFTTDGFVNVFYARR